MWSVSEIDIGRKHAYVESCRRQIDAFSVGCAVGRTYRVAKPSVGCGTAATADRTTVNCAVAWVASARTITPGGTDAYVRITVIPTNARRVADWAYAVYAFNYAVADICFADEVVIEIGDVGERFADRFIIEIGDVGECFADKFDWNIQRITAEGECCNSSRGESAFQVSRR